MPRCFQAGICFIQSSDWFETKFLLLTLVSIASRLLLIIMQTSFANTQSCESKLWASVSVLLFLDNSAPHGFNPDENLPFTTSRLDEKVKCTNSCVIYFERWWIRSSYVVWRNPRLKQIRAREKVFSREVNIKFSTFQRVRELNFLPAKKFHKNSFIDIQWVMRKEFGDFFPHAGNTRTANDLNNVKRRWHRVRSSLGRRLPITSWLVTMSYYRKCLWGWRLLRRQIGDWVRWLMQCDIYCCR